MNVREAAQIAIDHIKYLFNVGKVETPRLEETELSDDEKEWLVTISFLRIKSPRTFFDSIGGGSMNYERDYKIIRVDTETGKVKSVKIRKL